MSIEKHIQLDVCDSSHVIDASLFSPLWIITSPSYRRCSVDQMKKWYRTIYAVSFTFILCYAININTSISESISHHDGSETKQLLEFFYLHHYSCRQHARNTICCWHFIIVGHWTRSLRFNAFSTKYQFEIGRNSDEMRTQ